MMADVADYSEWKNGRRSTGFVFAGLVFALKAGLGFGGAISGWLLAGYGYSQQTANTQSVQDGIRTMASVYSAIPFALGVACMFFYPITKSLTLQISKELAERRAQSAPATAT
jgi:Na+/melibiose symporter-like transporter